jgi:hypothetical protein
VTVFQALEASKAVETAPIAILCLLLVLEWNWFSICKHWGPMVVKWTEPGPTDAETSVPGGRERYIVHTAFLTENCTFLTFLEAAKMEWGLTWVQFVM